MTMIVLATLDGLGKSKQSNVTMEMCCKYFGQDFGRPLSGRYFT